MRRRAFIPLVCGAAATWPLAGRAQQATTVIGFLSARSPDESQHLVAAFKKGLQTAGFIAGQSVELKYRWAEGQYDRLPAMAAELVNEKVAVLVTTGGEPSALAAKAATSTIPIVFTVGADPVKTGLVASLNRPGGNATGVNLLTEEPETKRFGLLSQVVPNAKVIGVLINPNYPQAADQAREVREAARAVDRQVEIATPGREDELGPAFAGLIQRKAAALLVTADPFFDTRRNRIVALAEQFKLPAMYQFRDYPLAGGLMSYGISITEGYYQVGVYAGQILKGSKPADLPIYQSIKFEFVINLKTAKALGIQIPDMLLSVADEVIE
jgi:putative tryptophan/tyrosine transport system substrate-binding protein